MSTNMYLSQYYTDVCRVGAEIDALGEAANSYDSSGKTLATDANVLAAISDVGLPIDERNLN